MPPRRKAPDITSSTAPPPKNSSAFDQVYRDNVDRISRLAQRLCGPGEDARDLVQETFLQAYRKFKQFRGESQISTWLYTIASRTCLRMRRRRKGMPARELSFDAGIPTDPSGDGSFSVNIPVDLTALAITALLRRVLHRITCAAPAKFLSGRQILT